MDRVNSDSKARDGGTAPCTSGSWLRVHLLNQR